MSVRWYFWWIFGVKSGSLLLLMKYVHCKSNLTGKGPAMKIYFMNACPRGWPWWPSPVQENCCPTTT